MAFAVMNLVSCIRRLDTASAPLLAIISLNCITWINSWAIIVWISFELFNLLFTANSPVDQSKNPSASPVSLRTILGSMPLTPNLSAKNSVNFSANNFLSLPYCFSSWSSSEEYFLAISLNTLLALSYWAFKTFPILPLITRLSASKLSTGAFGFCSASASSASNDSGVFNRIPSSFISFATSDITLFLTFSTGLVVCVFSTNPFGVFTFVSFGFVSVAVVLLFIAMSICIKTLQYATTSSWERAILRLPFGVVA